MGTGQPFPTFIEISRQYLLLPTNFTEKKSLAAPGQAASRHVVYVSENALYSELGCFFWGIINIWGFIPYCRDSPRVFNFLFPFGTSPCRFGETDFLVSTLIQPFTFPSLRFEYSVSVLEMPTRKLVERVICFQSFVLLGKRNDFLLMIGGRAN